MKKLYAELLLGTSFWGFGFVATAWTLTAIGPLWLTAIRFMIAIPFLMLLHRVRFSMREFRALFLPGFFLFALLALQTWGLQYTTPTKSGFITVLYVLFVPFFERIFLKIKMRKILFLWIGMALVGAVLICGAITTNGFSSQFLSAFSIGDLLTLLCAASAAAHLIFVNLKSKEVSSPLGFHIYQSSWVVLFAILFAIPIEGFNFIHQRWSNLAILGMIQLAFFSSGLAFVIQIRAQRTLAPSTVAIFMLLESPWAMISSVVFFKEVLTPLQILGGVLILGAAIAETLWPKLIELEEAR